MIPPPRAQGAPPTRTQPKRAAGSMRAENPLSPAGRVKQRGEARMEAWRPRGERRKWVKVAEAYTDGEYASKSDLRVRREQ